MVDGTRLPVGSVCGEGISRVCSLKSKKAKKVLFGKRPAATAHPPTPYVPNLCNTLSATLSKIKFYQKKIIVLELTTREIEKTAQNTSKNLFYF